ncbi:hypothetical protein ABE137_12170 [Brevibacillus laterosporus]|uniref:hypothetical protein n=1 Tax=Brevibacillus phage Sundance TaxID=1691958 RepID=UPI0006BC480D|nr:hypothetical protein [Brevibacillus laterosporus]YP_009194155.1 hypothetical protein AVT09_gp105 [Brevibacillus phage Sundance]ALA47921.1 hypothetical protein SUNDANCE_105 [Brevibacillus phage Sundance]MCR8994724.1 hypothetical protein [Brevibacillus laterosporus]
MSRLNLKHREILAVLRNAGRTGVPNYELSKISLRYGAYLGKLYEVGYVINKESFGNGIFNYTLVKEPQQEKPELPKAEDVLLKFVASHGSVTQEQLGKLIKELGVSVRYKAGTHQKLA